MRRRDSPVSIHCFAVAVPDRMVRHRRDAGLDIPPTISDQKLAGKTIVIACGGAQQHSGFRFAAIAIVGIVMFAISRSRQAARVPAGRRLIASTASRDWVPRAILGWLVTMIRRNPFCRSLASASGTSGGIIDFGDRHRRKGLAIANRRFIEDAVAIEKNRFAGAAKLSAPLPTSSAAP